MMPRDTKKTDTGKKSSKTVHRSVAQPAESESKVGSDRSAAEHFAGKRDFGIPAEGAGRFTEVAEEAKYQPAGDHHSDPRPLRSGGQGTRESGVGGVDSGPGSSSGGDLDTDLIGVGTGGTGIAEAGPDERTDGADMTDEGSHLTSHPHKPKKVMRGSTVDRSGSDAATDSGEGSGTASSPFGNGDDAEAGEISQGEAAGDDNTDIDNVS
jgi:hypothetical protein